MGWVKQHPWSTTMTYVLPVVPEIQHPKLTIKQHREALGWSVEELAKRTRMNWNFMKPDHKEKVIQTVKDAEAGKSIRFDEATLIANGFSNGYGYPIIRQNILGLQCHKPEHHHIYPTPQP